MRILIFTDLPSPLLDALAVCYAGRGNSVIYISCKGGHAAIPAGARRIILNFNRDLMRKRDRFEIWKDALKNGRTGAKALGELAEAWQPDLLLCSSGLGGAFHLRDTYPEVFLASFAISHDACLITRELESRLFLQSQLRYAPNAATIAKFPLILQPAIAPEPEWVDADYFRQDKAGKFACWKLDCSQAKMATLVLTGLSDSASADALKLAGGMLAQKPAISLAVLMDNPDLGRRFGESLAHLPGNPGKRLYVGQNLDNAFWRDLCASSAVVIFTDKGQKKMVLECLALQKRALCLEESGLQELPGVIALSGHNPEKWLKLRCRADVPDAQALEMLRRKYGREAAIPKLADEIMEEYRKHCAASWLAP